MAVSNQTFSDFGAGVSDIFAGFGDISKAQGDIIEGQAYTEAAQLAQQNAQYTQMSTAITEAQQQRELLLSTGKTAAETAAAGFTAGGSSLDILRASAAQGSLAKAVTGEQGAITQAGYQEQASSYNLMATAANNAAAAEKTAATGAFISGGVQAIAGFATL